ncbi:hypothetical protein [Lacisediminihabitans changchengi]|uniref:Uncharacterized protein n=1 Tax=Lacisediminihabitans changchengi TaxID=2787634 RepID=A0A934SNW7_9MICO|nr:hypothetical protein [Lacisediminihabitans changchengi]MBK4346388.1 hypothetical protein [Lacisediminihabitans changchengi]
MINPLRRRNRDRGLTLEQRDEVQKLVYELVQTRLIHAFGPRGLFTVTPHDSSAVDTFFAQAVADTIAWDVAAKLASPGAVSAPIEQVSAVLAAAVAAAPAAPSPVTVPVATVPAAIAPVPAEPVTAAPVNPETEASVSVDTAGVATVVASRFAPPAEPTAASQVADARAQSSAASTERRQLVA